MRTIAARLPAIARARRTTLLSGPTGSGKEVVARALHQHSPLPESPYVAVHCGAIPENLIEAELFGHTRGAFTGATQARPGLIRSAAGGTLFLDEVDSLCHSAQAKLLRFLESGEYRPVGSDRVERSDTWVIAATNQDLTACVQRGQFRSDLLYRLDVMRVDLPPLKLRGVDIELLAHHFLNAGSEGPRRFSRDALEAMARYDWPGNVRELKHRVERAALLTDSEEIDAAALGLTSGFAEAPTPTAAAGGLEALRAQLWGLIEQQHLTLGEAIDHCERLLIESALDAELDNRTRAASRLGIHVRTIFKKLSR